MTLLTASEPPSGTGFARGEREVWEAAADLLDPGAARRRKFTPQDEAALATPVTLAAHLQRSYRVRAHLTLIGELYARINAGEIDRAVIATPPQVGKTVSAVVWAAFWWLILHPQHRVIIVCYGDSLAVKRGRSVRRLVEEFGKRFGLNLDPASQAAHDWALTTGGGVRAVGIGSGITGEPGDCVTGETCIVTPQGEQTVAEFIGNGCPSPVLSFNHTTGEPEWRKVEASRAIEQRPILEITTSAGRTIRCTPDHRIYTENRGYVTAQVLQPGDRLICANGGLPEMRAPDRPDVEALLGLLHADSDRHLSDVDLRCVRDRIPAATCRTGKTDQAGRGLHDMLNEVPRGTLRDPQRAEMQGLREADASGAPSLVLLERMPEGRTGAEWQSIEAAPGSDVPDLFGDVLADDAQAAILCEALRRPGAFGTDDEHWQSGVQGRQELQRLVPEDEAAHQGTRPIPLRRLQNARRTGVVHQGRQALLTVDPHSASPERGPIRQQSRESDHAVPAMPHGASQVDYDTVREVRRVHGESHTVYDLQVEGNRNFFAGEILVHNCIIIDDPHKNREEAESPTLREKVGDAYSADILTRLAPKAPLVIVNTRWHPDDLTGRVIAQEGPTTEGGRWEMLVMPALCTDPATDPLGRSAGDPLPHPKIQEHDRAGALAHWLNAQKTNIPRDWFSMYQADPRPVEGAMVSAQILKERRCYEFGTENPCNAEPIVHAVAIDPSGGGRDNAGIVAGYLGSDERLYVTHDRSARMKSEEWSRAACVLAAEIGADRFIIEKNYGGDMCQLAVRTAWVALTAEEAVERSELRAQNLPLPPLKYGPLIPRVVEVTARKNKILRAEPIAQQIIYDRYRFAAYLPTVEHQWATYLPTSTDSPGNLDASVYLAYDLLPMPASGEPQVYEAPELQLDLTRALSPSDSMGYGDLDWR